jgi:cell division protein FtsZ
MDRRKFLQALTALGTSTALPSHALNNDNPQTEVPLATPGSSKASHAIHYPESEGEFPRIGIVAVGGAGGAICNRLTASLPHLNRSIAIDTNPFALHRIRADHKIQVGNGKRFITEPSIARLLAKQLSEETTDAASGLDLVFILAGMGGLTGCGISPIVAETLGKMNILTLGSVITPFDFEGPQRMQTALSGIGALGRSATTLLPISNEVLVQAMGENTLLSSVLDQTQLTFEKLYRNITNAICNIGLVGIDFEDVRVVLNEGGHAAFGVGSASGINCAEAATRRAITSPLLNHDQLLSATGLLVAVEGSRNSIKLHQLESVMNIIKQYASPKAHLLLSATYSDLADDFTVSILATGLPSTQN